jgi:hypothetical protein
MSFFSSSLGRLGLRRECTDRTSVGGRDACIQAGFGESLMPTQTHKRPGLRPAVESLIASCVPLLRDGGRLPLARVVEAAAGSTLRPDVMQALENRGDLVFERRGQGAYFSNNGPRLQIQLRRFDLIIPPRIGGQAVTIPGGVTFEFDASETLRASKFLLSVNLERLHVTSDRILVNVQGGVFDQCIDLV